MLVLEITLFRLLWYGEYTLFFFVTIYAMSTSPKASPSDWDEILSGGTLRRALAAAVPMDPETQTSYLKVIAEQVAELRKTIAVLGFPLRAFFEKLPVDISVDRSASQAGSESTKLMSSINGPTHQTWLVYLHEYETMVAAGTYGPAEIAGLVTRLGCFDCALIERIAEQILEPAAAAAQPWCPDVVTENRMGQLVKRTQRNLDQIRALRDTLVQSNLRLVVKVAREMQYSWRSTTMGADDLVQEGWCGLVWAINRFDLREDNLLTTYAIPFIRQRISRYVDNHRKNIRVPVHKSDTLKSSSKQARENLYLIRQQGDDDRMKSLVSFVLREGYVWEEGIDVQTPADYIKAAAEAWVESGGRHQRDAATGKPVYVALEQWVPLPRAEGWLIAETVRGAVKMPSVMANETSLDQPLGNRSEKSGNTTTVGDTLVSREFEQPDVVAHRNSTNDALHEAMKCLSPVDREIVMLKSNLETAQGQVRALIEKEFAEGKSLTLTLQTKALRLSEVPRVKVKIMKTAL